MNGCTAFNLRAWFSGKTSAFQADDVGSIPTARFNSQSIAPNPAKWFTQLCLFE